MIPSARLVLLAALPLALAVAAVLDPALARPLLAADGVLALVALADAWLARGRLVEVTREAPRFFSVGRDNQVRVQVWSRARRPLTVEVTDDVPAGADTTGLPARLALGPGARVTVSYAVRPARRGACPLGAHHVRYPSPLGLWLRQLRIPAEDAVKVYPDVKAVRTYELLARQNREAALVRAVRLRGGENEFERLREHRKDDEFRTIDWKATARRQRLIAREYQQERNQSIVGLLDCGRLMTTETGGLTHLDHALNALLMMSHVAARSGDQVGLCAFDAAVRAFVPPAGGPRATQRLLQATYALEPALVDPDFRAGFEFLARRLRKRALVVLFTQVIDDVAALTVRRLVRSLAPRHLPLVVLFRDPALDELVEGGPLARPQDLYLRGAAAEAVLWRDRLVRDLRAGGALVLHTPPARLTPALVNRYLEIKAQQRL